MGPLARALVATGALTQKSWRLAESVEIAEPLFHPQGLARLGEQVFVSTVAVEQCPERLADGQRSPGHGRGYLLALGEAGQIAWRVRLGEGDIYHPGGIDTDGERLWVPVAEYRPNSHSIIYAVEPSSRTAVEAFRVPDHIGAVAVDPRSGAIHGVSWGARTFYTWSRDGAELQRASNRSHYVDFQDCQFEPSHFMLCFGTKSRHLPKIGKVALGGAELIDLRSFSPVWQAPVLLHPREEDLSVVMTHNGALASLERGRLRFSFLPEDSYPPGETPVCAGHATVPHSVLYSWTPTEPRSDAAR